MASAYRDNKLAATNYDIHDLIKKRWSPRAFSEKPIEPGLLRQLFDAARWAPSSYNEQPWRFVVATKNHQEEYDRMTQVLNKNNKRWAPNAPVLMLTLKKDQFDKNNTINKHAAHDLGQAVSYMTFEAMRHNIYLHQMAGILPDVARELFHIPEHYTPMTMIAAGYLGNPDMLPDDLQKKEVSGRSRLEIDEIVFRGQWDNPKRL
ncbi:MAG: nitroreductase family protein [Balneolaceae bacterium]|nr:nitroreductase family protein [Balneolaceae bacterium]